MIIMKNINLCFILLIKIQYFAEEIFFLLSNKFKSNYFTIFTQVIYFPGGQVHWSGFGLTIMDSHGLKANIFLVKTNSFSACKISSSACPQLIFFSISSTVSLYMYKIYGLVKQQL